jgi:hypothetical protein
MSIRHDFVLRRDHLISARILLIQVRLVIGLRFRSEMSGPWGMTVETSCPDSLTIEWAGNRLASDRIRVARVPLFCRFASTQCQTCLVVAALTCQKRITSFAMGETLPEQSLQQVSVRPVDSRPVGSPDRKILPIADVPR